MLILDVKIDGEKVIIDGLSAIADEMPYAVQSGLRKIIRGVHAEAFKLLSGGARTQGVKTEGKRKWIATGWVHDKKTKTRPRGQFDLLGAAPGSYPVPRIDAHLRQLLNWVDPGETVANGGKAFTAGQFQAIEFDSADYASEIEEGKGSSEKYGPRPFIADAVEKFDQGGKIVETMDQEIQKRVDENLNK
jgi:hypothetical protein